MTTTVASQKRPATDAPPIAGPHSPRYLVDFHPKQMPHYFTDVLIIGGGLAGLRAANAVGDQTQTIVVTKDKLQESNSNYAQGGIASVWDPEDRFEDHIHDTLAAGGNFCDEDVVNMVVREAPQHVAEVAHVASESLHVRMRLHNLPG